MKNVGLIAVGAAVGVIIAAILVRKTAFGAKYIAGK